MTHNNNNSYSFTRHNSRPSSGLDRFQNAYNTIVLERALEQSGQEWIENINILEQLLVRVVDRVGRDSPFLKSRFILRRLPTYTGQFINKNEYGIVLQKLDFIIAKCDRPGTSNYGQIEIFSPLEETSIPPELLNEQQAYRSHELFKLWASAFSDAYEAECEASTTLENGDASVSSSPFQYSGDVQLVGAHLLLQLHTSSEASKIFCLNQPPLAMPPKLKSKCSLVVNHLKSLLTLQYEETEIVVRPCLFSKSSFPRVNSNILDRLPLHHPSYLAIGESLQKGFLLFPTSFESLWTIQTWPSESHLISLWHPSSIVSRVAKLYASFCLNPVHLWETINTSFILEMDDDENESRIRNATTKPSSSLPMDYFVSSFLSELEDFCNIEDWAPRNFATRFMHLIKTAVDSFDKGFHAHYYSKINILRGIWKSVDKEERSVLRELDDITESQEHLEDYAEKAFMEMDDLEDDFGFQVDDLETIDGDSVIIHSSRPTSADIYKSLSRTTSPSSRYIQTATTTKKVKAVVSHGEKSTTISRMFGSTVTKIFGSKLSRRHSDLSSATYMKSFNDVASGFEESIAQARRPDSLMMSKHRLDDEETSFYEVNSKSSRPKVQSFYSLLLSTINDLPPSDLFVTDATITPTDWEKESKLLESQEELASIWSKACSEFPRPKYICPHVFNARQIQYLTLIIQTLSHCLPNMVQMVKVAKKTPAWELSGDILRTVLHQMRTQVAQSDTLREKQRPKVPESNDEGFNPPKRRHRSLSLKKFSLRRKSNLNCQHSFRTIGKLDDYHHQLSLDDPEAGATYKLLEWLWNLKTSEVGRLSAKASLYIELLFETSLVNSYFLEQMEDDRIFTALALKSAVTVSRIMSNLEIPIQIGLCAATAKGWLWAEMILSLASWNNEKGYVMKATMALDREEDELVERVLLTENSDENLSTLKKKFNWQESLEPDIDAATLAYHSELATPIGWNDFEDPRRPGPFAAPILIFSSSCYYKKWEVCLGNIVQVLARLQKFNNLQHVGQLLIPPHRKTALNEIRKLNKTLSLRIYNFDDNVMSKTFRRLHSLRQTKQRMLRREKATRLTNGDADGLTKSQCLYSCDELGCHSQNGVTTPETVEVITTDGTELECTKL